jgi:putative membrane protein
LGSRLPEAAKARVSERDTFRELHIVMTEKTRNQENRPAGRSLRDYGMLYLKGLCMGASDVVPGVSGGTIAFILGIYEELINAIKSFDFKSLQLIASLKIRSFLDHISWQFLMALGFGILTAVFSLARLLSWLLENKPVLIWSFFFGLVLASVVTVSRRVKKWRIATWTWMAGGTIGTYFLVGLLPMSTPNEPWFLFMSGAIAICAMILPGISGSFILVLLGKYHYVLEAVNNRDFMVLGIVAAGACVGIMGFSRFLGWLFRSYHDLTVAILTGLMLGSLRKVWPWKETLQSQVDLHGKLVPTFQANVLPHQWSAEVTTALILAAVGFLVVILLDRAAGKAPEPGPGK